MNAPPGWDDILRIPDSDFHGLTDAVEVTKRLEYSWFLYRGDVYFLDDGHAQRLTWENALRAYGADSSCRYCSCTYTQACQEGCHWIADDLCSTCAGRLEAYAMELLNASWIDGIDLWRADNGRHVAMLKAPGGAKRKLEFSSRGRS